MKSQEATTILKRLQYSPFRLGFACGVYTQGGSEPFIQVRNERGPYAGQTDCINTQEEWTATYEKKYFPEPIKEQQGCAYCSAKQAIEVHECHCCGETFCLDCGERVGEPSEQQYWLCFECIK
jgi:hypothetical protein